VGGEDAGRWKWGNLYAPSAVGLAPDGQSLREQTVLNERVLASCKLGWLHSTSCNDLL
jgi:hypothetical protein